MTPESKKAARGLVSELSAAGETRAAYVLTEALDEVDRLEGVRGGWCSKHDDRCHDRAEQAESRLRTLEEAARAYGQHNNDACAGPEPEKYLGGLKPCSVCVNLAAALKESSHA